MSIKITLTCKNCNEKRSFIIGQKRSDANIDNIIHELSENNKNLLNKIISENRLLSFTFYRQLGICEKCNKYYVIPVLKIYTKDGEVINLQECCQKCNSTLKICDISNNVNEIKCLNCNMGKMEFL